MTSRKSGIDASAPTRIDLAGGTLDIWPLSTLVPDAVTVNLAIDLRAKVAITPRQDQKVAVISRDRGKRVTRSLPLRSVEGPLGLLLRWVDAFRPEQGLTLTTHAEAPAGAGLGGSSTLGIAVGAALARFTGQRLTKPALMRRIMNAETRELAVPAGTQDYLAALHGGLSAWHHGLDGTRREVLPVPEGLRERLVLAYTGRPRNSGFSNWEMFRRYVDGEKRTCQRMDRIASLAREMRDALHASDLDEAGRLLGEEGKLRDRLAPSVATPELKKAASAARRAGALGTKVCGAGGGGCLVAFAAEDTGPEVAQAMTSVGACVLDVGIARSGVRVASRR